jgi:hypothetical protein
MKPDTAMITNMNDRIESKHEQDDGRRGGGTKGT